MLNNFDGYFNSFMKSSSNSEILGVLDTCSKFFVGCFFEFFLPIIIQLLGFKRNTSSIGLL